MYCLLFFHREDSLILHIGLQGFNSPSNSVQTHLPLFFKGGLRIAKRVGNRKRGNYAVTADCFRYIDKVAHDHNRNAATFNFFSDRCTATSAGSSGGGEDHSVNSIVLEFFADGKSEFFGVSN